MPQAEQSLFSHLHEVLFHAWLAKLISLLAPRGVRRFSLHDAALMPAGEARPASSLAYIEAGENADLGTDIYGTT